ncbi:MAG: hypothetical protein JWQ95_6254 [Sphaerisporangium sp.]|jgi:uncharacterized OB-fold protein|nr:hypothetical protein [Sphaerisporangium sp.]
MSTPQPTPDTARYWAAAAQGRLEIQRCNACGLHYFYPRPFCRHCASGDVSWVEVSGHARLASYVITRHPQRGFEPVSPVIAIVELDEGPRLMTNIVDIAPDPDLLRLDMPLRVRFHQRDGVTLPVFAPADSMPGATV